MIREGGVSKAERLAAIYGLCEASMKKGVLDI